MASTESLYEDAWTQQQAELLRRLPPLGNELCSASQARIFRSRGPGRHWRDEIVEWRLQLEKILTRSIAAKLDLPGCYRTALRLVRRLERNVTGLTGRLPPECPYSFEQIVGANGEDWFPSTRVSHA